VSDNPDGFQELLRTAGITPDKPLYAVLTAAHEAAGLALAAAQDGARALSADGERKLLGRVGNAATEAVRGEFKALVKVMLWRSAPWLVAAFIALCLLGYGVRWMQEGYREVVAAGDTASMQRYCAAHQFQQWGTSVCALPNIRMR
jgi:hypothetical protein